jgi:hypothetical protein
MRLIKFFSVFEHGKWENLKAKRNKITGKVYFVLWEKGYNGRKDDYWVVLDKLWWNEFKKIKL